LILPGQAHSQSGTVRLGGFLYPEHGTVYPLYRGADLLMNCLSQNKDDFVEPRCYRAWTGEVRRSDSPHHVRHDGKRTRFGCAWLFADSVSGGHPGCHAAQADRCVLCYAPFPGGWQMTVGNGGNGTVCPNTAKWSRLFSHLFRVIASKWSLCLCNPAIFPPVPHSLSHRDSVGGFPDGMEPVGRRALVRYNRTSGRDNAQPDVDPYGTMHHENARLIRCRIIREMAGLDCGAWIQGRSGLLSGIIRDAGKQP